MRCIHIYRGAPQLGGIKLHKHFPWFHTAKWGVHRIAPRTVLHVIRIVLTMELLPLKGEVQSRIIIISKERVKISLQIGAKIMKMWIINKEVVTFWNFTYFRKTKFLDQSLWIFKWVSWWCHRLTICHIYHTWNFENYNFFFRYR